MKQNFEIVTSGFSRLVFVCCGRCASQGFVVCGSTVVALPSVAFNFFFLYHGSYCLHVGGE